MPDGQVLEFTGVTKRFGDVTAVSDLTAKVEPGVVTGFLGPNGAGKTTTLRTLLGLVRPTSGTATIGGSVYSALPNPMRTVGAVFEDPAMRPRRTARRHLTTFAKQNAIPVGRVEEVLGLVGLSEEAEHRIGSFSLGMRQRLSVATALLGDPGVLVLDEPANGLDPEGIRWIRLLMRSLADEGRTVLVSSHLLSEMQQIADALLIISNGHLVFDGGIEDLADPASQSVVVDSPDRETLQDVLREDGVGYDVLRTGLVVARASAADIGALTARAGVALSTLQQRGPSLEEVFLQFVTGERVQGPRPTAEDARAESAPDADGGVTAEDAELADDAAERPGGAEPTDEGPTTDDAETLADMVTDERAGEADADVEPADRDAELVPAGSLAGAADEPEIPVHISRELARASDIIHGRG